MTWVGFEFKTNNSHLFFEMKEGGKNAKMTKGSQKLPQLKMQQNTGTFRDLLIIGANAINPAKC